jgi:hypothetical protein
MADTKLKLNADLEADNVVIKGNLNVKGTTTSEHVENVVTKGALTIINAEGNELSATDMGTVIRTGNGSQAYAILYTPGDELIKIGEVQYDAE